uniref:Tetratricopeptide repeat protein 1 n=1 Tax=Cricetulus griseus TaxID=10029 RepID=A0A8C2LQM5_CRIGR
MEELENNCKVSEDMFNGLKVTDSQEVSDPKVQLAQSKLLKDDGAHPQEDHEEEECFHDSSASFEEEQPGAQMMGDKATDETGSSEVDEEYLREESTKLKKQGNEEFKREDYIEVESSYSQTLQMCPSCFQKDRSVLAAARMKQDKKEMAINDCSKAIQLNPSYIHAILRRAELYEKTDKLDEQIEEHNERLKEEMLGKLKDLGNLVLLPFGRSTENFQIKQDSSTGSYSINFVQNPNNNNR